MLKMFEIETDLAKRIWAARDAPKPEFDKVVEEAKFVIGFWLNMGKVVLVLAFFIGIVVWAMNARNG